MAAIAKSRRLSSNIDVTRSEGLIPVDEQEVLIAAMPGIFIVNAWSKQGWLEVKRDSIEADLFEDLLEGAWRRIAPKRAISAYGLQRR